MYEQEDPLAFAKGLRNAMLAYLVTVGVACLVTGWLRWW